MNVLPIRACAALALAALAAGCTVTGFTHPEDRRADGQPLPHTLVRESPQQQWLAALPATAGAIATDAAERYCVAVGSGIAGSSTQRLDAGSERASRGVFGFGKRSDVETARLFYECRAASPAHAARTVGAP